ncbi:MAG: hypothetical protein M1823_000814 [Watsoniomyces obsoletus]|nr:MAG: hypothetical protein M1823_000814 [Watsoniomyces obsoletus]
MIEDAAEHGTAENPIFIGDDPPENQNDIDDGSAEIQNDMGHGTAENPIVIGDEAAENQNDMGDDLVENVDSFRFLDLPREIRLMIYRHLLRRRIHAQEVLMHARSELPFRSITDDGRPIYPAILRTCQQVHQEASRVLYGESIFTTPSVGLYFTPPPLIQRFFSQRNLALVRQLEIHAPLPTFTEAGGFEIGGDADLIMNIAHIIYQLGESRSNIPITHLRLRLESPQDREAGSGTETEEAWLSEVMWELPYLRHLVLLPCTAPLFRPAFHGELVERVNQLYNQRLAAMEELGGEEWYGEVVG